MEKKKLLIYAHYYIPDTASTGQILRDLAEGFLDTFDVTVLCTVPSYLGTVDAAYKTQAVYHETIHGVHVVRVRVPDYRKTSKLSRVRNISSYFFGAMLATLKLGEIDFVYAISQPPVLGGLLGVWGKFIKRAKLIYNIQDFNPEQTMAVKYSDSTIALSLMMLLDKATCRYADKIILVGRDMVSTLVKRFKGKTVPRYALINNWINEHEIYPLPLTHPRVQAFRAQYGLADKYVVMYSGNLGLYYDLENILRVISTFSQSTKTADGREVAFVFLGAGSSAEKLKQYQRAQNMHNVYFLPYQDMNDLIYSLNAADLHWCISAKGIKGVSVPSKCYGIMAVAKPMLGVMEQGSEARLLLEETRGGLCCEPGDYDGIRAALRWFFDNAASDEVVQMGEREHAFLLQNLTKQVSVRKYVDEILSC